MEKTKITGIILAGGKSSRMGRDKGWIELNNKPLIHYAIEALKPYCDELFISSNSKEYNSLGYPIYEDKIKNCGPMGGIYSTLLFSSTPINMVLSCDMPLISTELIKYVLDKSVEGKISLPIHGVNFIEPLCAVYPLEAIPHLEKFIKEGKLKLIDLVNSIPTEQIKIDPSQYFYHPDIFLNINRPGDLERASSLLQK